MNRKLKSGDRIRYGGDAFRAPNTATILIRHFDSETDEVLYEVETVDGYTWAVRPSEIVEVLPG